MIGIYMVPDCPEGVEVERRTNVYLMMDPIWYSSDRLWSLIEATTTALFASESSCTQMSTLQRSGPCLGISSMPQPCNRSCRAQKDTGHELRCGQSVLRSSRKRMLCMDGASTEAERHVASRPDRHGSSICKGEDPCFKDREA